MLQWSRTAAKLTQPRPDPSQSHSHPFSHIHARSDPQPRHSPHLIPLPFTRPCPPLPPPLFPSSPLPPFPPFPPLFRFPSSSFPPFPLPSPHPTSPITNSTPTTPSTPSTPLANGTRLILLLLFAQIFSHNSLTPFHYSLNVPLILLQRPFPFNPLSAAPGVGGWGRVVPAGLKEGRRMMGRE